MDYSETYVGRKRLEADLRFFMVWSVMAITFMTAIAFSLVLR